MARPTVHDSALRARLLDITAQLVDRDGPSQVALRQIAAEAGTSTSAIYSLFGSKADLLAAVMDHGFASFGASQRAASAGGLAALGAAYREWALGHPALYRLMFGGALAQYADCVPDKELAASAIGPLREAVAAGQAAGFLRAAPLETVVTAVWAQVHGLVSLELAQVGPHETDWSSLYSAALESVRRAWSS